MVLGFGVSLVECLRMRFHAHKATQTTSIMHQPITHRPRQPRSSGSMRITAYCLLGLLLIWPSALAGRPAAAAHPPALGGERLVLAFYYSWFDENTWRNETVPDFPTTLYASRDRAAMARQIEQAQSAGIDAFVVSWYGPRTENNQTETNLRALLDEASARNFRIVIDFETQGPFFGSSGEVTQALRALLATHANHPAYLRVEGRPVIFFWRQQRFGVGAWQALREEVDPNRQALWIAEGVDISFQQVFDGHHLYSVAWSADPGAQLLKWGQRVRSASQTWGRKIWVATVMPGYNDTRTGRGDAFIRPREDGAYYAKTWNGALASGADWVIITSWNEWPEGTYIEPSQAHGSRYLDLTREWTARYKNGEGAAPAPLSPSRPRLTPTPAPTPVTPQVVVRDGVVNLRAGPGVTYRVLEQLTPGRRLLIVGRSAAQVGEASWWRVCCARDGGAGWVATAVVEAQGPLTQAPVVLPPAPSLRPWNPPEGT